MTIRYIPEGDKFRANQLWGEGRHQLSILKNLMSFGNLQQDQRTVSFADGTIIKCLSCFGQDVVNIYVPPPLIGGEPEYRERVEIKYYPAIEVYYDECDEEEEYMGVVLCKGGGFNPPYEYIQKDSLPIDYIYEPAEKLREERIWTVYDPNERDFEDIVPSGIAQSKFVQIGEKEETVSRTGGFVELITHCKREWHPLTAQLPAHWNYAAESRGHYVYDETSSERRNHFLSYKSPDDPSTYIPINLGIDFNYGLSDNYSWDFVIMHDWQIPDEYLFMFTEINQHAVKYDGEDWVRDDIGVTFDTATAAAESAVNWERTYALESEFSARTLTPSFIYGLSSNVHQITDFYIRESNGNVMNQDKYAVAYSVVTQEQTDPYHSVVECLEPCIDLSHISYDVPQYCLSGDIEHDDITTDFEEGPLCVAVDDIIFEVSPATPTREASPRLQMANVKYFNLFDDTKSIGLFFIKKNYAAPYDYLYVYCHVLSEAVVKPGADREKKIETPVEWIDGKHLIPDVKGKKDGEDIDLYGHGTFRLIREEITIKEMATADQPGLFREIIE